MGAGRGSSADGHQAVSGLRQGRKRFVKYLACKARCLRCLSKAEYVSRYATGAKWDGSCDECGWTSTVTMGELKRIVADIPDGLLYVAEGV